MKLSTVVLMFFFVLAAAKFMKIAHINNWLLIGMAGLWFVMFYWQTHQENAERNRPRPVYIADPY